MLMTQIKGIQSVIARESRLQSRRPKQFVPLNYSQAQGRLRRSAQSAARYAAALWGSAKLGGPVL